MTTGAVGAIAASTSIPERHAEFLARPNLTFVAVVVGGGVGIAAATVIVIVIVELATITSSGRGGFC